MEIAIHDSWNTDYRDRETPWELGHPSEELVRVVEQRLFDPCGTVELGCGTGANAVFLATNGFDVTAVDCSDVALDRARDWAAERDVYVRFVQADLCEFFHDVPPCEFLFERSCYEFARRQNLDGYRETVLRLTRPGSRYLLLCGDRKQNKRFGPPGVSEADIRRDWEQTFEIQWLRKLVSDGRSRMREAGRWSCLMVRRTD